MRGRQLLRRLDSVLAPTIMALLLLAVRLTRFAARFRRHPRSVDCGPLLVVCYGAIGDLLLLSAVIRTLCLDRKVLLACTASNYAAAAVFDDVYVDVVPVSLFDPFAIWRIARSGNVREIVDSTQWANVSGIHCAIARCLIPEVRVRGFQNASKMRSKLYAEGIPHSPDVHEAVNFARCVSGRSTLDLDLNALVQPLNSDRAPDTILLHLWPSGKRSHLKEWPLPKWKELAEHLAGLGGLRLGLSGGIDDCARNDAFIRETGLPIENLAGRLSVRELDTYLRERVALFVSVNTGPMHLAALAGVPTVALTGPTNPARWGPVGPSSVSLLPASGPRAYLNYGWEYPRSDSDAYSLDRLEVGVVLSSCLKLLAAPDAEMYKKGNGQSRGSDA